MSNMKPLYDLLSRLKISSETRRKAEEIYRQVSFLTKTGSEHAITQGLQTLPAACLCIASSRLGNTDVTKDVARHVACVDVKTFEKAHTMVERALSNSSPTKSKEKTITYQMLIQQFGGREDAHVPMVEVQRAVAQSSEAVETSTSLYQAAIFSWVYVNVLKSNVPTEESIRSQVRASLRDWAAARRTINKCCLSIKDTLIAQAETALSRPARRLRSQSSQISVAVPITPSSKSLASSMMHVTPLKTPQLIPSMGSASSGRIAAMKRKSSIIEEISSPAKRLRTALYPSSTDNEKDLTARSAVKTNSNAVLKETQLPTRADRTSAIVDGNDSEADIPNETIVIPRQRPIPSDLVNESGSDPFLQTKTTPKPPVDNALVNETPPSFKTPSKKVVRIVETPMTTTGGMSNASSPCSSPVFGLPAEKLQSSSPSRRSLRVKSSPAINKKQLRLPLTDEKEEEEEEVSRRQRRNLRAAFLNPNIYGWNPSPPVLRRLKLAENWEKKLIAAFGDPWDDL